MRSVEEIQARIRGMLFEELQRRVAFAERRLPCRCTFNLRHRIDSRSTVEGEPNGARNRLTLALGEPVAQTMGLCMYGAQNPEEWPGDLCEDEIDAQRCKVFQPKQSKEEILAEFTKQVQDYDWVVANMPGAAALLWVLDRDALFVERTPWWTRLWWWLLRIRLEPIRPDVDLTHLLPQTTEVSDGLHNPGASPRD